jgi:hypothetical protein
MMDATAHLDQAFIADVAALIIASVQTPSAGGVSRLINESYFTFRYEGESGFLLTDEMRRAVEAHLGEPLVERVFKGLEAERFLVPASAAGGRGARRGRQQLRQRPDQG